MKLRSGRQIVRKKNIYLPTEVWVDVFCFLFLWITRPRMAQMVPKIGNRWFGEQLQFYLHEWGKHTLEKLYFKKQGVCKWKFNKLQQLEFPQTTMPDNIRSFESFKIDYFNNRVFNFFRRIQSVLTADTKLEILFTHKLNLPNFNHDDTKEVGEQVRNARFILDHLLPFIDGIHTLYTDDQMLPQLELSLAEKFHQIKVLDVKFTDFVQPVMQIIMEWLTSSNEPKLLQLFCVKREIAQQVLETIHKQFMEAMEPSTFAVIFFYNNEFLDFSCDENAIGEQLYGIQCANGDLCASFQVFRHQANNAEAGNKLRQWLEENTERVGVRRQNRCIRLCGPKIGRGRIFALPDVDEDGEKPSTSMKSRICKWLTKRRIWRN